MNQRIVAVMYGPLIAGYACAAIVMLLVASRNDRLWPRATHVGGLPLRYVVILLLSVIAIGQLAQRGLLFPTRGTWRNASSALNQLVIFAPVFGVAIRSFVRGGEESRMTVMLPRDHLALRLGLGLLAALIALIAHHAFAGRFQQFLMSLMQIMRPGNLHYAIQILGEDVAIAMLLASLMTRINPRAAVIATGLLFALGHVPAVVAGGGAVSELGYLVADGVLAAAVVGVLLRLRDVWVLWPAHVAMDLTQFLR